MARRSRASLAPGVIIVLSVLGMCGKVIGGRGGDAGYRSTPLSAYSSAGAYSSASAYSSETADASSTDSEGFYAHEPLNVRSGPGTENAKLRTVARGEYMLLGAQDSSGWAPIYNSSGEREGYVYRASDAVRSSPPPPVADADSAGTRRRSSASSREYHVGPRGGCYTYTASGRKRYVARSYCD